MDDHGQSEPRLNFDYIKSTHFRVVRADGAIGGLTPNGFVHAAVFSERPAIPRRVVHRINPDGTLGPEIPDEQETRGGIVREMEFDLFLTVETAERIARWMLDLVEQVRAAKKSGNGQSG